MTAPRSRRLIAALLAAVALAVVNPAAAAVLKGEGHPHSTWLSRWGGVTLAFAGVGLLGAMGGALVLRRRRPASRG